MGRANILIRATAGAGDPGPMLRAASFEGWLRRVWPEARVTVFAEGPPQTLDWLYTRVHDLVPICPMTPAADESWARATRGPADLVLFDGLALTEERRRTWQPAQGPLIVRCDPHRTFQEGLPLAGWRHGPPGAGSEPEALLGFDRALLDPRLEATARDRRPPAAPARRLAIVLGPVSDPQGELALVSEAAGAAAEFEHVAILAPSSAPRQHLTALRAAWPGAAIESSPDRAPAILASADLALLAGPAHAAEALALGTPSLLVAMSRDEIAAVRHLGETGAMLDLGAALDLAPGAVLRSVQDLGRDVGTLRSLSFRAASLVDGKGFARLLLEAFPHAPLAASAPVPARARAALDPVGSP